ncbi:MOSC and FAD-binding oxidoreductase domain-containing protein [Solirubrobacter ginsenosidimutans]|uniref:nitric oxide dioxygenase n=1 Tax=Solirubrobacter ginsenosidimutans TaxID=490573 RepID=A0A9X3RXY7_9ACTN|nr:MOSC and FAD-binding oxidoreductase domain-containing protein [Solirubrobacter ginsenosidimutans]MDA0159045.1 MOSC and FAD-binding oxidoreductase domain-containing protein [Solirubrobacter ginsenosidimutans]
MSGRLVSLNVGGPRDVAWEGKTVRTAIWKTEVEGPRMVRRINIDGDDQADRLAHGGEHRAVFVYQLGSYRYWERELGRDDFTHGQFGENFTVEGLADDEVCIGDRYRIGEALFEVTQPRVTCYRVGIRFELAAMPSLLVAHHRPGFYLRVLEEGSVQAGDAIEKVADGPERLTVADTDALLYLPGKSPARLERALRIPALSEGWKGSFRDLLAKAEDHTDPTPAWAGFMELRVAEVRPESASVTSFRLVPEDGSEARPAAAPGQYLTLRLRSGANALVRSYSLSDVPGQQGFRVSVKRDGAASRYLHEQVKVGDVLDVAAPRGAFVLRAGTRPVVLVSAGVGATPVLAMLHALAREHSTRSVWWLHGARNRAEHAFHDEADALLGALEDAHRVVAYSRPGPEDALGADYDVAGRLDLGVLEHAGVPVDADYYLCGPAEFMSAIEVALGAYGVAPERISTEAFGAVAIRASGIVKDGDRQPHAPDGGAGTGPTVTFVRSSLAIPWDDRYPNLLDFAEACDVPVGFGCRNGVCHNCESGLLTGDVTYDIEPLEPPPAGRVLVCCTRPGSEVTLDL